MNREQKIDAIYEKIARKDLYRGDVFYVNNNEMIFIKKDNKNIEYLDYDEVVIDRYNGIISDNTFKFKGGPVMIGDLLDWIENDYLGFAKNKTQLNSLEMSMFIAKTKDFNPSHIFEKWEQKRLPLEEQSDECVDFVYDLISE